MVLLDSVYFLRANCIRCPRPTVRRPPSRGTLIISIRRKPRQRMSHSDVSYYGVDEMGEEEAREFLSRYDRQKTERIFDDRRVLEKYCQ